MKRSNENVALALLLLAVSIVGFAATNGGAQEREKGPRKPEPVQQNWRVHVVEASELEKKLEELNRASYSVVRNQILPVGDKLVVLVNDDSLNYPAEDEEECEDCH